MGLAKQGKSRKPMLKVCQVVESFLGVLSEAESELIWAGNAIKFYNTSYENTAIHHLRDLFYSIN